MIALKPAAGKQEPSCSITGIFLDLSSQTQWPKWLFAGSGEGTRREEWPSTWQPWDLTNELNHSELQFHLL